MCVSVLTHFKCLILLNEAVEILVLLPFTHEMLFSSTTPQVQQQQIRTNQRKQAHNK